MYSCIRPPLQQSRKSNEQNPVFQSLFALVSRGHGKRHHENKLYKITWEFKSSFSSSDEVIYGLPLLVHGESAHGDNLLLRITSKSLTSSNLSIAFVLVPVEFRQQKGIPNVSEKGHCLKVTG